MSKNSKIKEKIKFFKKKLYKNLHISKKYITFAA